MKKNTKIYVTLLILAIILPIAYAQFNMDRSPCAFKEGWLIPHKISTQVKNGEQATDCNFYQYAMENFIAQTEWYDQPEFLDFMSVSGVFDDRSFMRQDPTAWGKKPLYNLETCDLGGEMPDVVSDLVYQAGNSDPLLDQNSNYTYYDVRMNKTLYDFLIECRLGPDNRCLNRSLDATRFPPGAQEIKIAWKVLTGKDNSENYITSTGWVKNPGTGKCSAEQLGLVGYHLVMSTDYHPEMLWSSWTHTENNPVCATREAQGKRTDYSYYSNDSTEKVNTYVGGESPNICNPKPEQGTRDNKIFPLTQLREGYSEQFSGDVLGNYKMLGVLWTDKGVMPALSKAQRGQLLLAHPQLESFYQDNLNCFSCHSYDRPDRALAVSHINDVITNKRLDQQEAVR